MFLALGCATPDGRTKVPAWAFERGFAAAPLRAGDFALFALERRPAASPTLAIYIEGDGAPWSGVHHPPRDPTPHAPVALSLAAADPSPAVAWLARPCQYLDAAALTGCSRAYWTDRRFAPEVIAAYDAAVGQLKARAGARRVRLAGHSGGGVIAVLVALQRDDVERVITVAAPLALAEWVAWHDLTPLAASLDPQGRPRLAAPGVHFAGARDNTVPPAIVERYVRAKGGRLETLAGYDHECCWSRDWPRLLERALAKENAPSKPDR